MVELNGKMKRDHAKKSVLGLIYSRLDLNTQWSSYLFAKASQKDYSKQKTVLFCDECCKNILMIRITVVMSIHDSTQILCYKNINERQKSLSTSELMH